MYKQICLCFKSSLRSAITCRELTLVRDSSCRDVSTRWNCWKLRTCRYSALAAEARVDVKIDEARRFIIDCFKAVGAPESEARAQADLLMTADITRLSSHGFERLDYYLMDIQTGSCNPAATPQIMNETCATAWVDGCTALGATVGNFCMSLAIQKARACGIGWISAKNSNHFGISGYWPAMALREGMIGLALSNTSPVVVPTGAKVAGIGTNPISFAAPATCSDRMLMDIASTSVALGKIKTYYLQRGVPLPVGYALDSKGNVTTDPKEAIKAKALLPLGGLENGHKGFCLCALVEVLCHGLSGSKPSHKIRVWSVDKSDKPADLGQCFAAIDPCHFAPGFEERLSTIFDFWRGLEPRDPKFPVIVPGDIEAKAQKEISSQGTVSYAAKTAESMNTLAKKLNVRLLQFAKTESGPGGMGSDAS